MSGKHTPGPGMSIATTEQVRAFVSDRLASLERHFIPAAKLTFLMRVPDMPDCWMVVSNDPAQAVFAAAPELLEACEELCNGQTARALVSARIAINKARMIP